MSLVLVFLMYCCSGDREAIITYILLIELIKMLKIIEEWPVNKINDLLYDCFVSYLEPSYVKGCTLLRDDLCSSYDARPFPCRLYGLYPDEEWDERLKNTSVELGIEAKDMEMAEQCRNLKIKGKNKCIIVSRVVSDDLFRKIHHLDINLFPEKEIGREIVLSSRTYMPFDTHFLLIKMGPDALESLTDMKIRRRGFFNQYNRGEITKDVFDREDAKVREFLLHIRSQVNSMGTGTLIT